MAVSPVPSPNRLSRPQNTSIWTWSLRVSASILRGTLVNVLCSVSYSKWENNCKVCISVIMKLYRVEELGVKNLLLSKVRNWKEAYSIKWSSPFQRVISLGVGKESEWLVYHFSATRRITEMRIAAVIKDLIHANNFTWMILFLFLFYRWGNCSLELFKTKPNQTRAQVTRSSQPRILLRQPDHNSMCSLPIFTSHKNGGRMHFFTAVSACTYFQNG